MSFGYTRVASAVPQNNDLNSLTEAFNLCIQEGAQVVVFPELVTSGVACGDMLFNTDFIKNCLEVLLKFIENTIYSEALCVIGAPIVLHGSLYNTAVVAQRGKILAVIPKSTLSVNETRYFSIWNYGNQNVFCGGHQIPVFDSALFVNTEHDFSFSVSVGEDIEKDACGDIVLNLSSIPNLVGASERAREKLSELSLREQCGILTSNAGLYEKGNDLFFGHSWIIECGKVLKAERQTKFEPFINVCEFDTELIKKRRMGVLKKPVFTQSISISLPGLKLNKLNRFIIPHPFIPDQSEKLYKRMSEIFTIQTTSLAKRIKQAKSEKILTGVSGGLDSTLSLLVCAGTADMLNMPRESIMGITMPGFGTTARTKKNATLLMEALRITDMEIDITKACRVHFNDIGHDENLRDVTFENTQARERTQILMDLANKHNGIMVGSGNMSEIALGFSTYGGDHMSMYNVNSGIPKTVVRCLVRWLCENMQNKDAKKALSDILNTPVSPELLPSDENGKIVQKTEEIIGNYELHDFFLYNLVRNGFGKEKIFFLAKTAFSHKYSVKEIERTLEIFLSRFYTQQFKRNCSPDGPIIGTVSLAPNKFILPS